MRLSWPESPWRRADVVVGTAYLLVGLWGIVDAIARVVTGGHLHGKTNAVAFLVFAVVFDLLCALPGIGVAKGMRQGFVLSAMLSGLGFLGAMFQWLVMAKQPTIWYPVIASYDLATCGYCAFRLRSIADPGKNGPASNEPFPPLTKGLDLLAGALNAVSALAFVAMIFAGRGPAQSPPSSSSETNLYLVVGGLTLVHLALCAGVALGRRFAFVLMELWLGFVLLGEVLAMRQPHSPVSVLQVLSAVLHAATMAYCIPRSRKAPSGAQAVPSDEPVRPAG